MAELNRAHMRHDGHSQGPGHGMLLINQWWTSRTLHSLLRHQSWRGSSCRGLIGRFKTRISTPIWQTNSPVGPKQGAVVKQGISAGEGGSSQRDEQKRAAERISSSRRCRVSFFSPRCVSASGRQKDDETCFGSICKESVQTRNPGTGGEGWRCWRIFCTRDRRDAGEKERERLNCDQDGEL